MHKTNRAMQPRKWRAPGWRLMVTLCAFAPLTAMPGPPAFATEIVIWEGNDQSVFLSPQDATAAPPNDHPVTLAAEDVERMLVDLRFRFADQEPEAPPAAVFNPEQVKVLGEALATGLAMAEPFQDVTFSVVGAHRLSPGAFARRNRLTAGRLFFREGELNLILGEIQSPYRKKNIYGRINEDFYPRQYGSRTQAEKHESELVATAGIGLHGDPQGERVDWVVFDPGIGRSDTTGSRTELASAFNADAPAAPPPAGARPAPADEDSGSVEQRLRALKDLREQDLISEQAYRQKVDEILEDL